MTTEVQIVSFTVYVTCSKHIQTKINKGGLHLELELLKRLEAVLQMEMELHICSFQNPFSFIFNRVANSIFQHLYAPEVGPEGGIRKMPIMFIQRANMLNNFPKIQG